MTLKKCVLCLSVLTWSALVHLSASAIGNDNNNATNLLKSTPSDVDRYIGDVYGQLDFSKGDKLSPAVFGKAMRGYLSLQDAGKLNEDRQILTVADFSKSSTQARLWVIDLKKKKVLYNTYVAHGQGSGDDMATVFSNLEGTHASSLGFYVTSDTYTGEHGNSLRLKGMDNGFNDAALSRGIVVHAAEYVSKSNIACQGRLGRSWGCPAIAPELAQPIINAIKGGTCLFIYHPNAKYEKTAYWMNRKIENLPVAPRLQLVAPGLEHEQIAIAPKRDTTVIYMPRATRI